MALVTLCPECNTTFRVTSEQLEAHSGDVRCGQCQHVFNSFATLITVEESEIRDVSVTNSSVLTEASTTTHTEDFEEESIAQSDFNYFPEENATTYDDGDESFDSTPVKEKLSLRWFSACCVLIILLLGQIVYFYRVELSVAAPETKPLLEAYCGILNCTVPYPRDITLLSIESSELYANPSRQTETTMTATIRNYASFPQVLPALKLSLMDKKGKSIASRVFSAEDYLASDSTTSSQPIKPNHEVNIRIDYDSGGLNATGYQLFLLYP
ncbi:MAG: zinc-ribbon and DUF3426 domain-containing protein [Nitrosomonas sp.]|nr:zinc-ribbon and DUF3426 domain-containing protein [Nitrosomonas sp.]